MSEIDLDAFEGFAQGSWILSDEGDGYFIIKDAKGNYLIVGDGCLHGKVADLRLAAAAPDLLALAKQQREEIERLRKAAEHGTTIRVKSGGRAPSPASRSGRRG